MSTMCEIVCIQCPMACRIELRISDDGTVAQVSGYHCKEGKTYAPQEYESPKRILTTTMRTAGSKKPVLPVRSREPIPKAMLINCMGHIDTVTIRAPLKLGDTVVANILNTGIDIICTDDLAA